MGRQSYGSPHGVYGREKKSSAVWATKKHGPRPRRCSTDSSHRRWIFHKEAPNQRVLIYSFGGLWEDSLFQKHTHFFAKVREALSNRFIRTILFM